MLDRDTGFAPTVRHWDDAEERGQACLLPIIVEEADRRANILNSSISQL